MKPLRFHPEAEAEMRDAAAWYEAQRQDLGKNFLTSVQEATQRVQINPRLSPIVALNVRRRLVRTFPFGVLFRDLDNQIVVMAVMHLHRDPDYWKSRRPPPSPKRHPSTLDP